MSIKDITLKVSDRRPPVISNAMPNGFGSISLFPLSKKTIPQIFFDDIHIGGYDEVRTLEKENKLQDLIK